MFKIMEEIKRRRSVYPRLFNGDKVSKEELKTILEYAKWAPTHKLTQPWRFAVFMDAGLSLLEKEVHAWLNSKNDLDHVLTKKIEKASEKLNQSSAVLAIIMKRDPDHRVPEFEEMCSVACAVQNIWIALKSHGMGGYWSTGMGTDSSLMREFLNLREEDKHLGWFLLGKTDLELPLPENRMEVDEFTKWYV